MRQTIVQIRYQIQVPLETYRAAVAPMAPLIADVPGLLWKIWVLDSDNRVGGGVYLFADPDAARLFLDGPLVAEVRRAPILSDFQVSQIGVVADLSAVTRGPLALDAANVAQAVHAE